jgi:aspartate beta-hydroxylase
MLDRPCFKPHLAVQTVRDEGVVVTSGTGQTVLRGRLYELVAPWLDGRPTTEICQRLRSRAGSAAVLYTLAQLEKRGFLTEADAPTDVLSELERRGAARLRHGRASFAHHLRGTYNLLTRWRQPARVCLAGLLHSAYSTDRFSPGLFRRDERTRVSELIGATAERLVYLFCSVGREELFAAVRQASGPVELLDREGGSPHVLTRREVGDLLVLHLANAAEQHGPAGAARFGPATKALAEAVPPAFDDPESDRPEPERLYLYLAVRGALGRALPPRFAEYLAQLPSAEEGPWMDHYPGLTARPWHAPHRFPVTHNLERAAPQILAEFRALDPGRFADEAQDIGRVGRWSVLFLYERGRRHEDNCRLCPTTAALLEEQRAALCPNGIVYFSCLDPKTRIAPHRGPTNLRLRCHLGVEVPDGCGLEVGGVAGAWQAGRCLVFDDSFEHAAWNDADRRRVVLVIDIWHPDLTGDEILLLNGLEQHCAAG